VSNGSRAHNATGARLGFGEEGNEGNEDDRKSKRPKQENQALPEDAVCIDLDEVGLDDPVGWARNAIPGFLETHDDLEELKLEYNVAAGPGTVQYNRFCQAWTAASNKEWRLVFHGTPARNVDSICTHGLDPTLRKVQVYGKGEYFSFSWRFASRYCKGGDKLIIFVVLCDESGVSYYGMTDDARTPGRDRNEIIVVHKPEYQLPLAVLTFRDRRSQVP